MLLSGLRTWRRLVRSRITRGTSRRRRSRLSRTHNTALYHTEILEDRVLLSHAPIAPGSLVSTLGYSVLVIDPESGDVTLLGTLPSQNNLAFRVLGQITVGTNDDFFYLVLENELVALPGLPFLDQYPTGTRIDKLDAEWRDAGGVLLKYKIEKRMLIDEDLAVTRLWSGGSLWVADVQFTDIGETELVIPTNAFQIEPLIKTTHLIVIRAESRKTLL